MAKQTISLTANGVERQVQIDRRTTLLQVLHDQLGLTGSRVGCGQGQCGAFGGREDIGLQIRPAAGVRLNQLPAALPRLMGEAGAQRSTGDGGRLPPGQSERGIGLP
ncbi:MAG: 2Fe-2S iron-sulfur cluster binding domain-containing protein [Anaerolineae bacterium]|nr:2Fe-2S iron-sulfur cluster binding domain-containing protein [Anaerolineae bacterium]